MDKRYSHGQIPRHGVTFCVRVGSIINELPREAFDAMIMIMIILLLTMAHSYFASREQVLRCTLHVARVTYVWDGEEQIEDCLPCTLEFRNVDPC